ncbi:MAG: hypothetical protein Q9195_007113 [Heterodermia aff. obscurata]
MGKIRVKVVVLPYSVTAREEAIAPWIEPCEEDLSLQALCEKIVETFADLHEGKGDLNIKRIQDYDGNTLSCRLAVGEAFKESQNIADRTVKVLRLPSGQQELRHNPLRFASIAPTSSARPQKRWQGTQTSDTRDRLREIIDADTWVSESTENIEGRASKRQRLQDVRPRAAHPSERPYLSSTGAGSRHHQRPPPHDQRDSSVHVVEDSQQSPARRGI